MNKCLLLLKVRMLGFVNPSVLLKGTSKDRSRFFTVLFPAIVLALISFINTIGITIYLKSIGMIDILPSLIFLICTLVVFILTFLTNNSVLFGFKDYDMIMAMPVTNKVVITSRLLTGYLLNIVLVAILGLPPMIIFGIAKSISLITWIVLGISIILIPLIPIVVATFTGVIIGVLTSKLKNKNLFRAIFTILIALILMFVVYGKIIPNFYNGMENINRIIEKISNVYPIVGVFNSMLVNESLYGFLIFTVISIVVTILFVYLVSIYYLKLTSILSSRNKSSNYKESNIKHSSSFKALYTKEFRRLITTNTYLVNSIFGGVLMLLASIAVLIITPSKIGAILGADFLDMIEKAFPFMVCVFLGMTSPTSASMSFEGNNRWIPFSMPVELRTIYNSKIALALSINMPISIISNTLLSISFKLSIVEWFLITIMSCIFIVFTSVLGLALNIKFPKYDWTTEQQIAKQGTPVIMLMFICMIVGTVLIGLSTATTISHIQVSIVTSIILSLVSIVIYKRILKINISVE